MDILMVLMNTVNLALLITYCIWILKRKIDSSLFWLLACLLYFVNVPLLFDSIAIFWCGIDDYTYTLKQYNNFWEIGMKDCFFKVSVSSLVFNVVLILSYHFATIKHRYKMAIPLLDENNQNLFMSYKLYAIVSLIGLVLFMYNHGLSTIVFLGTGRNANVAGNRFTILFQSLFLGIGSIGIIRGMVEKRYVEVAIIAIPVLLVAYITGARSQIIALAFAFIYYYIWKADLTAKQLVYIVVLGLLVSVVLTSYRGGIRFYPLAKDGSYADLFYSFENQNHLATHGENFKRLLLTGFYKYQTYDITFKLADFKFFKGWGSLHPSMLGWAYIDLGNLYWLLAAYFGVFLGMCDVLRYKLPFRYNLLFVPFVFIFSSVAARGSVQYAYASIIYPFIIMCLFLIFRRYLQTQ